MTFYNLPDTDVTLEYDKNSKLLTISNLPEDYTFTQRQNTETDTPIPELLVMWATASDPDEAGRRAEAARIYREQHPDASVEEVMNRGDRQ